MNKPSYTMGLVITGLLKTRRLSILYPTSTSGEFQPYLQVNPLDFLSYGKEDLLERVFGLVNKLEKQTLTKLLVEYKVRRGGLSTRLFKMWERVLDFSRIFFCNLWLCAPLSRNFGDAERRVAQGSACAMNVGWLK